MSKTLLHCSWLRPKNLFLSTLLAARQTYRIYLTLRTDNPLFRSLRNFIMRSGITIRSVTEGQSMLKQHPLVGAARMPCHNILTKPRDTRPASFRIHRGGVAGCPENNNTVYSSNKCDSGAVKRERRHCVHEYGFRQISNLSGNR